MSVPEIVPAADQPPAEQTAVKTAALAVPETENTGASPHPEEATKTIVGGEPTSVPGKETTSIELNTTGKSVVEASPAVEGVLGYKAPGFLRFRYAKHYFWFDDERKTAEHMAPYIRKERVEIAHPNAAWAEETGKGVLFYAKRPEDRDNPDILVLLANVSDVTKEGTIGFSFKAHHHTYKFEAANSEDRDAWIVAMETKTQEAKEMKESIMGSEGYKKTLEGYAKNPALISATAATAAAGAGTAAHKKETSTVTPTSNGFAKETDGTVEEEPKKQIDTAKSRSQSRKRLSVFGAVLGKKEEKEETKEELTEEQKAEKVAAENKVAEERALADEKAKQDRLAAENKRKEETVIAAEKAKKEKAEHDRKKEAEAKEKADRKAAEKKAKEERKLAEEKTKDEKKAKAAADKKALEDKAREERKQRDAEAALKREEAQKEHDAQKAKEAAETAAIAAAPVAAVAAEKKHEEKKEENVEDRRDETNSPTDKKAKRNSLFGGFFGKKDVNSPTEEEREAEVAPAVPAKDVEVAQVSESAPMVEEPVENKPLDTAAVLAAGESVHTPAAKESVNEHTSTPVEAEATTPREEKGLKGFTKKIQSGLGTKKEQRREEEASEAIAKDPVIAAAPVETTIAESVPTKDEERPAREKRRSSLFNSFGTLRKKTASPEGARVNNAESRREKSPLPVLGGLFRKPSKAVKPTAEARAISAEETKSSEGPINGAPVTNGHTADASTAVAGLHAGSSNIGDKTSEEVHATTHDIVTNPPVTAETTA